MTNRVVISVVAGRDVNMLFAFLESLDEEAKTLAAEVVCVVTANEVGHEDLGRIRAAASSYRGANIQVVTNERRRGFAANHNRTMREHPADYYLISNDDVVVRPGAISVLLAYMEDPANARVAVASPQLLNADGSVQGSTYSFPSPTRVLASAAEVRSVGLLRAAIEREARSSGKGRSRFWAHDRTMHVDSVRGAFVLVRASAVADVGPMDEISMVGGEELEWHRRMAERGWKVSFVHNAEVTHFGSQTVSGDATLSVEYVKGWLNFFQKHGRAFDVVMLRFGLAAIYAVRVLWALLSSDRDSRAVSRAGLRLALAWPKIWHAAVSEGRVR